MLVDRLGEKIPTMLALDSLWGIDLHEWDCVITNRDYTSIDSTEIAQAYGYGHGDGARLWTWKQSLPGHISVIYAPTARTGTNAFDLIDFQPPEGTDKDDLPAFVLVSDKIDGRHISYVEGLPPAISDLVKQRLVPIAQTRDRHTYFELRGDDAPGDPDLRLRPFLFGPRDVPLAANYERTEEASGLAPPTPTSATWLRGCSLPCASGTACTRTASRAFRTCDARHCARLSLSG